MAPDEIKKFIAAERAKGTPDAQIYDAVKSKQTSPTQTQQSKPQRSFWGEVLPSAFAVGGGILGGIAGAPLGPAGVIAGGIAGAGAGGAVGEGIQQNIEKSYGERQSISTPQIVGSGVVSAAAQATGLGAEKLIGAVAKPAIAFAAPPIVKTLKYLSGYSDEVISRALARTPGAVAGVQKGEAALDDIVRQTAKGISEKANAELKASKEAIAKLSKGSSGGAGEPGVRQTFLEEGKNFVNSITSALRSEHNVGVAKNGMLTFDRASQPSRIVAGGDKGAIQSAFDTVQTINKNTSINHIDAVLERLISLRTKTPVGSPTGPETKAILGQMISSVKDFASSLGKFSPVYTKYVDHIEASIPRRIMIEDAKEIFGGSANLSAKEVSMVSNRLLQVFNSGKNAIRGDIEKVGSAVGTDPIGAAAGVLTKTGSIVSQRAKNLTSRGLFEKAIEFLPRAGLNNYVATGKITGELFNHPKLVALSTFLGVSKKVVLQEIAHLMANKTTE